MADRKVESCGRCSLTTVIDASERDSGHRDIIGEARIEVDERDIRRVNAHHVLAGRVKARLDAFVHRLTFGPR